MRRVALCKIIPNITHTAVITASCDASVIPTLNYSRLLVASESSVVYITNTTTRGRSQCFVLHNSKHRRNVSSCFTLITFSCKERFSQEFFPWSWKSSWKERTSKREETFFKCDASSSRSETERGWKLGGFSSYIGKKMEKVLRIFRWFVERKKRSFVTTCTRGTKANAVAITFSARTKDFYWIIKIVSYRTTKMILCFSRNLNQNLWISFGRWFMSGDLWMLIT